MGAAFKGRSADVLMMVQHRILQHRGNMIQYFLLSKHNTVKTQPKIIRYDMT